MRKLAFCICENKGADQLCGNRTTDQAFVFATQIVQSLFFLNPKFQASSHLLWLYSPIMSDLVENSEDRFSHNEAHIHTTEQPATRSYISTPASAKATEAQVIDAAKARKRRENNAVKVQIFTF